MTNRLCGLPADAKSRETLAVNLRRLREETPITKGELKLRIERHARHAKNRLEGPLTLDEFGARCRRVANLKTVGYGKADISRWESATRMPGIAHLFILAKALSIGRKKPVTIGDITGIPMKAKVIKI